MHVEDIQKDADAQVFLAVPVGGGDGSHFAVRGSNNQPGFRRNRASRVSKEPQEEASQQDWNGGPDGSGKPSDEHGSTSEHTSVVVAVANHGCLGNYNCTAIARPFALRYSPAESSSRCPSAREAALFRPGARFRP